MQGVGFPGGQGWTGPPGHHGFTGGSG